eukprot:CAMPEP_0177678850 /NCGR_PEP_ID=MMETSP0447-20121125/29238_1 /TAXON_ID=0 /ORGANISM="Stygamoeba regulata, Strain BSH-02190019" /LENGTH=33 /DNA_ID= /DNA_START= /DNA_END= /DNA_ORIENTATION=
MTESTLQIGLLNVAFPVENMRHVQTNMKHMKEA